jgi:hypothetical protein
MLNERAFNVKADRRLAQSESSVVRPARKSPELARHD